MPASAPVPNRILRRISAVELERRWSLLRAHLENLNLGAAVTLCSEDYLGGYVRWLTDRPATNAYNVGVIFHRDGPMTMIHHGPDGQRRDVSGDPDYAGTQDLLTTTAWRSVNYTQGNEGRLAAGVIRQRGYGRIGVMGPEAMPKAFADALAATGAELVDITDFMNRCMALKSEAELVEIRETAAMQDEVFQAVVEQIRPGMRDLDVMALAQAEGRTRGSEQGVFLVSSQVLGRPTFLSGAHAQARQFERGDHLTVLVENNGPAGYYTELGRTIVIGRATEELRDSMAVAIEAQQNTLDRLRPNTACADIARAHDAFMETAGLGRESRLFAHSQGYDLVERPLIRADESTTVEAGMNIVVHPSFVANGTFGYVCDNFIVQAQGAPLPIHATEQRIFEVC